MLSCKFRFALSIAVFLWGAPAPAQTLTTGTIVGAVTDSSGAVVRGAIVTLDATATGDHLTAASGDGGEYRFPLLKPGEYRVSARAPGLQSGINKIDLLVGQQEAVNLVLNVERAQQSVEVDLRPRRCCKRRTANSATSVWRQAGGRPTHQRRRYYEPCFLDVRAAPQRGWRQQQLQPQWQCRSTPGFIR